jgi:hypothetical protein
VFNRRRFIGLIALVVLAAACGKGSTDVTATTTPSGATPSQDAVLASFLAKSQDVKTFKVEMVIDTQGAGDIGSLVYEGEVDAAKGLMRLEGSVADATVQIISDGTSVFVKLPPGARQSDKPWTKTDVSALGGQGSSAFMSSDPKDFFAQIRAAVPDLHADGSAAVRGEFANVYSGTLDLDKALEEASADQRAAAAALGSQDIPIKIYVGNDGLLYREVLTLVVEGNEIVFTMECFDYGKPVKITLPPQSQVAAA